MDQELTGTQLNELVELSFGFRWLPCCAVIRRLHGLNGNRQADD